MTPSQFSKKKTKATVNLPSTYLPVIHLNGTSKKMLVSDYQAALEQLRSFREEFASIEFHARDYYVIDDCLAYGEAQQTRTKVFELIEEINSYLMDHLTNLIN